MGKDGEHMVNIWGKYGKIKCKKYRRNMGKILETNDFTRRN